MARWLAQSRFPDPMEVLLSVVSLLVVMVPLWRITRRTGRDPWLSMLNLVPVVGSVAFAAILAFGRWPAERTGPSRSGSVPARAEGHADADVKEGR